jgi:hypothetical protein
MKKSGLLISLLLIAVLLASCSKKEKFEPTKTSVYVKQDGTVVEALFDTLEGENEDAASLKSFVEQSVIQYNSERAGVSSAYKGTDDETVYPVNIQKLEIKGGNVTLFLEYQSGTDYDSFNLNRGLVSDLSLQSVIDATIPDNMVSVKDGVPADANTIRKNKKYYALTLYGEANIQVEGKVLYASSNVKVLSNSQVSISAADEPACIVFE